MPRNTKSAVRCSGRQPLACSALVALACLALASCGRGPGAVHPDLVVEDAAVSDDGPAAGASFTFSATVRNAGRGDAAATTLSVYRSEDATVTTADQEVGAATVAELGASASMVATVTVTAASSPGTYYYGACVDPVAGESDTANNCSATVRVVVAAQDTEAPPPQPDLVVEDAAVSDDGPAAGASFTFSATVRNAGDGDAAATTLSVYRSEDATVTTADQEVGAATVAELGASASMVATVTVTAASSPGTYYYGACVDPVAGESDTANNCSATVRVVVAAQDTEAPPPQPDLVVEDPTVSDDGPAAGASFTFSATVRNAGDGDAAATRLSVYRSEDETITPADEQVSAAAVAELAASQSKVATVTVTAASSPGTYYYGACVDPVAGESDTANNCSATVRVVVAAQDTEAPPPQPDLVVEDPTVSDDGPAAGASFTFSATVRNAGDGDAAATRLSVYRSEDETITPADEQVSAAAVAELAASASMVATVTVTAASSPGTYYYGACVDPVAGESDTANDCSATVRVVVAAQDTEPPPPRPDLVVEDAAVSDDGPAAGASFTFSATVRNAGDGDAAATTLSVYRSEDATVTTADQEVGAATVAELGASASKVATVTVTAASSPGTYYYGACVDPVAGESDTANNCSATVRVVVAAQDTEPPPPRPDLVVEDAAVSDDGPAAGASFTFSATVRNAGDGDAAATTLSVYRSEDATVTTADQEVGAATVAELGASASMVATVTVTAASSPGTYYYGACVDPVAEESDTANNCSARVNVTVPVPVQRPPVPVPRPPSMDLKLVRAWTYDADPALGGVFDFAATVERRGTAERVETTMRFYRSTDQTITPSDTQVATRRVVLPTGLPFWGVTVRTPSSKGTYYYGACVDVVAGESDTTNNCSAAVTIEVSDNSPDLWVGSWGVWGYKSVGKPATFLKRVYNRGGPSEATTLRLILLPSRESAPSDGTQVAEVDVPELVVTRAEPAYSMQTLVYQAPATAGRYYYVMCVDAVPGESDITNNCSSATPIDFR